MTTFAIYAHVKIIEAPEWVAPFMEKYGSPTEPHVTLKQTCFIEEGEKDAVRSLVENFFASRVKEAPLAVTFNSLRTKPDWDAILVDAEGSPEIYVLQKELVEVLVSYKRYVEPELEGYEKNFKPHLTIADGIPESLRASLSEEISGRFPFEIRGAIHEVILAFGDTEKVAFDI